MISPVLGLRALGLGFVSFTEKVPNPRISMRFPSISCSTGDRDFVGILGVFLASSNPKVLVNSGVRFWMTIPRCWRSTSPE